MIEYSGRGKNDVIYEVKGGLTEKFNVNGTYVSNELILSISIWISNDFYIKVNKIVMDYYIDKFNKKYKNDSKKLLEKANKLELKMDKIKESL